MEPDHIRGYLISVKKNGENGCSYAVRNPICYIGRDTNCDIRIRDENMNDRHCCIRIESAKKIIVQSLSGERPVSIKEVENVNGMQIQDEKIASSDGIQIKSGTLIKILDYTFRWINVESSGGDTIQRCSFPFTEKLYSRKSDPIVYQVPDEPKINDENENSPIEPIEQDENMSTMKTETEKSQMIENTSMNPRISSTVKETIISSSVPKSPSKNISNMNINKSLSQRSRLHCEISKTKTESGYINEKRTSLAPFRLSRTKISNSPLQENNRSSMVQTGRSSFRKSSFDLNNPLLSTMSNNSIGKLANNDVSFTQTANKSCTRPMSNYYDVILENCKETSVSNENITLKKQDNDVSNDEKSALRTPKSFINAFHSTPKYSQSEKSSFSDFNSKLTDVAVTSQTNSEMFSAATSFTNNNACVQSALPFLNGVSSSNEDFNSVESASKSKKRELDSSTEVRRNTRSRSSIISKTLECGENDHACNGQPSLTTPEKTNKANSATMEPALMDSYSPEKSLDRNSADTMKKSIESGNVEGSSAEKAEMCVSLTMLRGTRDLSYISPPENSKSKEFMESMVSTPIKTSASLNRENEPTLSPVTSKDSTVAENESTMSTPKSLSIAASRCRRSTIEPMVGTPSDVYRITKCFVTPGNRSHFNRTSLEVQTSNMAEASRRSERKSTPMKAEKTAVRDSLLLYSPIIENQKGEEEQSEDEPYKFVSRRKPRFCKNSFADENRIVEENETIDAEDINDSLQPLDSFEQENNCAPARIVVGGETDGSSSTFGIENEDEELNKTFDVEGGESRISTEEEKSPTAAKSIPKSILTPLPRPQSTKLIKKVTFTGLNEIESDGQSMSPYSPRETVDDMSLSGVSCNLSEMSIVSETNKTMEEDEKLYREDEPSELNLELSSVTEPKESKSISPRLSGIRQLFVAIRSPTNSVDMSGIKTLMETPVAAQETSRSSDVPEIRVQEATPFKENSGDTSLVPPIVRRCSKHLRIHRNSICESIDATLVQADDGTQQSIADCSASLNNSIANVENGGEEEAKANYDRVVDELKKRAAVAQQSRYEKREQRPIEDQNMASDEIVASEVENDIGDEEIEPLELSLDGNIANRENFQIGNEKSVTMETEMCDEAQHDKTPASESSHVIRKEPQSIKHVSVRFEGVSTPVNSKPTAPKRISTPYVRAPLSESPTSVDDIQEYSIVEDPIPSVHSTPQKDDANVTPVTVAAPIDVRTATPLAKQTLLTPGQLKNKEMLLSSVVTASVAAAQQIRTSTPLSWFIANKGIDPKTFYAARNEGTITEISSISALSSNYVSPSTVTDSVESTIVPVALEAENIMKMKQVRRESQESTKSVDEIVNEEKSVHEIPLATAKDEAKTENAVKMVVAASNAESAVDQDKETTLTEDMTSSTSKSSDMVELEQRSNVEEKIFVESIKSEVPPLSNEFKMELILRGSRKSVVLEKFRTLLQGMDVDILDLRPLKVENSTAKKEEEEKVAKERSNELHEEEAEEETKETVGLTANEIEHEIEKNESTMVTRKKRKVATANAQTATAINRSTRRAKNKTKTELMTPAEILVKVSKPIESEDTANNDRPIRRKAIRSKDAVNDDGSSSKSHSSRNLNDVNDYASTTPQVVELIDTKGKRPKRHAIARAETVAVQPPSKLYVTRSLVNPTKKRNAIAEAETIVQSTMPTKLHEARNSTDKLKAKAVAFVVDASNEINLTATTSMTQKPVVDEEKTKKRTQSIRRLKSTVDNNSVVVVADEQLEASTKTQAVSKSRTKAKGQKNTTVGSVENTATMVTEEQQPPSLRKSKRRKKIDDTAATSTLEEDRQKEKRKPLTTVLQNIELKEDERKNKRKNVEIASEPEKTKKPKRGTKVDSKEEKLTTKSKKKSDEFTSKSVAVTSSIENQQQSNKSQNNKRTIKTTVEQIPSAEPPETKQTKSKPAKKSTEMNAKTTIVTISSPLKTRATRNKRKMAAETSAPQSTTTTRSKRKLNTDSETEPKPDTSNAKSVNEPATKRIKLAEPIAAEKNTRTRRQPVPSTRSRRTNK